MYRVLGHGVIGGASGGSAGAAGAGFSQVVVPAVGDAVKEMDLPLEVKQAIVLMAGIGSGGLAGGTTGAITGGNATVNNYLTAAELRNKQQRLNDCRAQGGGACEVAILREYDLRSAQNSGSINYDSVLTKPDLEAKRSDLQQLVNDPSCDASCKAQASRSIAELNTAINVIDKAPALADLAQLGLIALDVAPLGSFAAGRVLTSTVVKQYFAAKGVSLADDAAARIANNFYRNGHDIYSVYKRPDGSWNWPPNGGAIRGTEEIVTLPPG